MYRNTANIISFSRMIFALAMLFFPVLSPGFYIFYIVAGLTDVIDGWVARRMGIVSEFGSKLDSIADIILVVVTLLMIVPTLDVPLWLWIWIVVIIAIKVINPLSGYLIFKKFIMKHTLMNKVTGLLLFLFPFTLPYIEFTYTAIVLCAVATFAAIQEGHLIRTEGPDDT